MKRAEVVQLLCDTKRMQNESGKAFSPANIALCKYWGKRDGEINLPFNSSLSLSLGLKGTQTSVSIFNSTSHDKIVLEGRSLSCSDPFAKRIIDFLDLFRFEHNRRFLVETTSTIPIAAGLASSASGFAALTQALNDLYGWELDKKSLSILARLGSGSASRSLWNGFVKWHAGRRDDGLDSFAEPLSSVWSDLCIGLVMVSKEKKKVTSRQAMQHTAKTSCYYTAWREKASLDLPVLETSILNKDFELFGQTAESNALAMHATTLTAWPPVLYWSTKTVESVYAVWKAREKGLALYFTQDAGPNIKLLFLQSDKQKVEAIFPEVEIVMPFVGSEDD